MAKDVFEKEKSLLLEELKNLEEQEKGYQQKLKEKEIRKNVLFLYPLFWLRRWWFASASLGGYVYGNIYFWPQRVKSAANGMANGIGFILISFLALLVTVGFIAAIYLNVFENNDSTVKDNTEYFVKEFLRKKDEKRQEEKELESLAKDAEYRKSKIELLQMAKKNKTVFEELKAAGLLEKL